jgi:hypothetical protein
LIAEALEIGGGRHANRSDGDGKSQHCADLKNPEIARSAGHLRGL